MFYIVILGATRKTFPELKRTVAVGEPCGVRSEEWCPWSTGGVKRPFRQVKVYVIDLLLGLHNSQFR